MSVSFCKSILKTSVSKPNIVDSCILEVPDATKASCKCDFRFLFICKAKVIHSLYELDKDGERKGPPSLSVVIHAFANIEWIGTGLSSQTSHMRKCKKDMINS
jgi:hypothetical protein